MKHLKLTYVLLIIFSFGTVFAQSDITPETKLNQSGFRQVSGNENIHTENSADLNIPQHLLNAYTQAGDIYDDAEKLRLSKEIDKYLQKTESKVISESEYSIEGGNLTDWYEEDNLVYTGDISSSSFRTLDLVQAEDGRMYLLVLRRNVAGFNSSMRIYISNNGGASWGTMWQWSYATRYIQSVSMLVERRDNNNDDSTRIMVYFIGSDNASFNNAGLFLFSIRSNGTAPYTIQVETPAAGNRFTYVSACSDGMFFSNATSAHIVTREETNAGNYVSIRRFRSTDFGITHASATLNTVNNDYYPSVAFSNETGNDSIYIAVERRISATEWEIRLIAASELPNSNFGVRYITDAASGTLYERPAITIQQRHFSLPQQILVTSTKNDRAVYHGSVDGGASWDVDYALGLSTQAVDFTSCNSDSLTAGGGYFVAAYVDLNGDSVTVRRGVIGAMGNVQHNRNSNNSTSVLAPVCAIYRSGTDKSAAFSYAGVGPENLYYNMENLITGIEPISNNVPDKFSLGQNYPNPFNPVTSIQFSIPKAGNVKLVIYNMLGGEVETLMNGNMNAGTYKADWDASGYSSGVYFYRIISGDNIETKKMMLIK